MSINAENLVKIVPVVAKIVGGIWWFLPSHPKRCSCYPELILIKFAQYVATVLPFNIFESELPSYLFQNTSLPNEGHTCHFRPKLVAMAISIEELEKEIRIDHRRTNTYYLVKKLWTLV